MQLQHARGDLLCDRAFQSVLDALGLVFADRHQDNTSGMHDALDAHADGMSGDLVDGLEKSLVGLPGGIGELNDVRQAPERSSRFIESDMAVDPDAEQLAQIAVSADRTARALAEIDDPKIAMLSFSTKGSAKHERVDKVIEATRLAKEMNPNLKIDGELQADAAIVPCVGASKAPGSDIAGQANVLVFPDLGVGNIAYKLVQRIAGAKAVGPVLQGLAAPVNDLSRGCNEDDIYRTVILTCNQAINK